MNRRISLLDEWVFTVNGDLRHYDNTKDSRIKRLDDAYDITVERLNILKRYFKFMLGFLVLMFVGFMAVFILLIKLFTK